jgi:DNA helicase II / ATP-dependent DNA helicase PcrA
MTNVSAAQESNRTADDHVDGEIAACLDLAKPRSFFLFAGAGSGKTRSLVNALKHLRKQYGTKLRFGGQRIAVITYTNAACDEIVQRTEFDPLIQVSTIHSFAWQLIGGFNADIRQWLKADLIATIAELEELEAKGRTGTKASVARQAQIASKRERLHNLDRIRSFVYSPTGDNRETNALNHSEVIALAAHFLSEKPLMQSILVRQFPALLIDEGQDTNRHLVDALFRVQGKHSSVFCLGFFGDTMQRIYNDGKERIEAGLPAEWEKPIKKLNHRSPKRVVELINKIRSEADAQEQEPLTESTDGIVRMFVFPATIPDKPAAEDAARSTMSDITGDEDWKKRENCKILTLEHHMAAKRMGFQDVFEPLYAVDDFRTGLLDGTLPATRLFARAILPLVNAQQRGDKFAAAKVVRDMSPLLGDIALKSAKKSGDQLIAARNAVDNLMSLWEHGEPRCWDVLERVAASNLFVVPDSLKTVLALKQIKVAADENADAENEADRVPERIQALETFLNAPFSQVQPYAAYVSDAAPYDTHQGVKGREFERVMVVMDALETRGFMFDYEKLFGVKPQTAADERNMREGKETSLDRTRRLFYVTCSRARKSLAIVAYSEAPELVRRNIVRSGWFRENEVILEV